MHYLMIALILLPVIVFGQPVEPVPSPTVTTNVPADVFNYFAGAAGLIILGLVSAIGILWKSRAQSGMSADEHEMLKWLKDSHDQKTEGVFDWIVPRVWGTTLSNLAKAAKQQADINDVRDRLEQEQTERREQVEALLREQKDIMQIALETNNKVGSALEDNHRILEKVAELLKANK